MKQVQIYGTLGPACASPSILSEMLSEGMTGVRLNLSHTTLEAAEPLLNAYRAACDACGVKGALLIDMQGPELRIGPLLSPIPLNVDERIAIHALPFPNEVTDALNNTGAGRQVLLDDGKLLLETDGNGELTVLRGGILESRKSVALVGVSIPTPAMTEADKRHIRLVKSYGVTGVMQPFVRGKDDLLAVRHALNEAGAADIRLFAKIENRDGMRMLSEILPHCDEIVIARGDLGNAMPLWELPAAQKRIAASCRKAKRDFMVVTQMLDSMLHRAVPTRAEVSDIYNAVLDGAASVMLTGETAAGDYPALAMRYLCRTVRQAQTGFETL